jgi:hypothetical protein
MILKSIVVIWSISCLMILAKAAHGQEGGGGVRR